MKRNSSSDSYVKTALDYLLPSKGRLSTDLLGGHGQQRGHPEGHAGRDRVGVQPEADPGHDDQHAARDVDCQQVVGELPLKC